MARKSRKGLADTIEVTKKPENVYRTAVYVRLSIENSGKDDDGASIENQKKMCLEYVDSHKDLKLYGIYEDNGRKGTNTDRPEFQRMMADIQKGKVNCIIVKDLSRFSRDYIDAGNYLEKVFPFMGVRFISVTDHFDSLTAGGDENSLIVPMKNMLNAAYAKDISRKIITSFRARQKKCEILPAFGPYGYLKSEEVAYRYELDPDTAPFVKKIFEWTLEGKPFREIRHMLEELGAPTPAARKLELGIWHDEKHGKTRWNNKTLADMLSNPTYTGCIVYGRMPKNLAEGIRQHRADPSEWRVYRDMHEPLVSWEDFEKVQQILKERSYTHYTKVKDSKKKLDQIIDPFRGKIYCGDCGKKMRFIKQYSPTTGKNNPRYACSGYLDSGNRECSRHSISAKEVESTVLTALKKQQEYLQEAIILKRLSAQRMDPEVEAKLRFLKKQMDASVEERGKLYEKYIEGELSKEEYAQLKKSFDEGYDEMERESRRLRKREREKREVLGEVSEWFQTLKGTKNKHQLTIDLLEETVERVEIFEGERIEVEFKYKEEREKMERVLIGIGRKSKKPELSEESDDLEESDASEDSDDTEVSGEEVRDE